MAVKRVLFKKLRKVKGTQADVALQNNISSIYLRKIENGTCTPGRDLMFKLSSYFGESAENLFPDYFEQSSKTDN